MNEPSYGDRVVVPGAYPIVTSQHSSTTSYHFRSCSAAVLLKRQSGIIPGDPRLRGRAGLRLPLGQYAATDGRPAPASEKDA
jgi:hypothetical protein